VADTASITLHSSWRHLVLSGLGAAATAALGTWAVVAAGFGPVPGGCFVIGWLFVAVVVFDVPMASTFTADHVERRMLLRRQRLAWRPGDQLTRARPSLLRFDRTLQHGGLVLRRGVRRYLLVDRVESADEFDRLVEVVEVPGRDGEGVGASILPRPAAGVPPTWLYRRRHWRPDPGSNR
jgi:hypothetical protein